MADVIVVGDTPLLSKVFYVETGTDVTATLRNGETDVVPGTLTNPTTVSLTVQKPDGSSNTYTYAGSTITRLSTGVYDKQDYTADQAGDYIAVWTGTGTVVDTEVIRFTVFSTSSNLYCTPDQMKSRFGISDVRDDFELERACRAAARRVESYCDRDRFWRDAAVQDLVFDADSPYCVRIKGPRGTIGISTATGVVVKTDEDGDGVYERTLTVSTDFLLKPLNAVSLNPAWPYETIEMVGNSSYRLPMIYGRPGVQVTARFGWPAVPDDVSEAALILSHRLFKRKETSTGVVGFDALGATVRLARTDPDVAELLDPYRRLGIA